jgi:sugar phosphate isomerase/epimerase
MLPQGDVHGWSRRTLLGAGAGLATGAALGAAARATGTATATAAAASPGALIPPGRIGLQLYSVRDAVADVGFAKVLETVAQIGFKHVEFAGYTQGSSPEITVKELRSILDANGLVAAGSHVSPSDDDSMKQILDDAEVLGIPQVGVSLTTPNGVPATSGWKATAEQYTRFGELAAARGIGFYFHNHFQEWLPLPDAPDKRPIDILLAESDPKLVSFEMDVFWAHVGASQNNNAFDPLNDYAIPFRDRIRLFHVKDGIYDALPAGTITDVGEGKIDFQTFFTKLFEVADGQRDKHLYLWERDNAGEHPRGPLAAARTSYVNIRHGLTGSATSEPAATSSRKFRATIAAASVRGRRVRATLRVSEAADAKVTLSRGDSVLATASRRLAKGAGRIGLRLPRGTAAGPAKLRVSVTDGDGVTLVTSRILRVP